MRSLTPSEKRTIRLGGICIAGYLLVFGGYQTWKFLERKRADYLQLVKQAGALKQEIQLYQAKKETAQKLMEGFKLDPASLSSTTAVAQASLAIQQAALGSGIQVGPVRESPARPANKELASVQLECTGPVPAITGLLNRLEGVGFPLVIETVQITAEPTKPGQIKLNLTVVILDFDQWKKGEVPNA